MKLSRNAVAILVVMAMIMSLVPFGALAEVADGKTVAKFTFTVNNTGENSDRVDYGYVRTDKPAQWFHKSAYTGTTAGDMYYGMSLSAMYRDFIQLDLSGYEEILRNDSTTIYMNLQRRGNDTKYNLVDHSAYFAPDNCDFIDFSSDATMNYSVAQATGFTNEDNLFYIDSDGAEAVTYTSAEVSPENLIKALDENPGNSKVSLYIKGKGNTAGGSASRVAVTSSTYFAISYDESEIDNQAYVNSLAEELSWEYISNEDINAVANNINLPSSYHGADLTWSTSNADVITADGIVKIAPGVRSATLTAAFSYKGIDESAEPVTATKDFVVSVVSEEAKEVTVPFINYAHARSDQAAIAQKYSTNSSYGQHYVQAGGMWYGFAQFDLSAYEEILRSPNTKLSFKVLAGNGFSSSLLYDFKAYLAPDGADIYKNDTVTYNSALQLGIIDTTRPILAVDSDGEKASSNTWVTVEADKEALLQVLDESATNAIVTVYIKPSDGSTVRMKEKNAEVANGGLVVTYYDSEVNEKAYLDKLESAFKWEDLTSDSAAMVEDSLPTYYKGAEITWSSDKNVIKPNGELIKTREGDVPATLTATVSYKGYTFTKDFSVVIAKLQPVTKRINASLIRNIGVNYQDEAYPTKYESYYMQSGAMYDVPESGRGDVHVFAKFDLSDSLKELEVAQNVTVTLRNRTDTIGAGGTTGIITVLSDRYDEWDGDITYNSAINSGMYTDPGYCKMYGITFNKNTANGESNVYDSEALASAIKNAVAANPDEGIVSIRLSSTYWGGCAFQSGGLYITISYYEEDLMTDAELSAAKKDKMQWTALTSQDIDNVVADLTLPATWYGAPVSWTSSDETVITSSGEVIIGSEAKNVTLTATVDGAVNTFNVRVPANKLAMQSEYTHTKEATKASGYTNGSNLNYSAAIVYANDDIEGTPDVIIATYDAEGLLKVVTVKENVTLKKGINCIPSRYHYEFGTKKTKAFVVDDIETLNPLGIAR